VVHQPSKLPAVFIKTLTVTLIELNSSSEEWEWDPNGEYVTPARQDLDEVHPQAGALRDAAIDEKRVLLICKVHRIATFGKPTAWAVCV